MFNSFAEESIRFQCNYARTINVDETMIVPTASSDPVVGQGNLSYRMEVTVGQLGGTTRVQISPNHELTGIAPT